MNVVPDIELEVADGRGRARGLTPEGEEWLDAYTAIDYEVLDAGHISVPEDGVWALTTRAQEAGLRLVIVG